MRLPYVPFYRGRNLDFMVSIHGLSNTDYLAALIRFQFDVVFGPMFLAVAAECAAAPCKPFDGATWVS